MVSSPDTTTTTTRTTRQCGCGCRPLLVFVVAFTLAGCSGGKVDEVGGGGGGGGGGGSGGDTISPVVAIVSPTAAPSYTASSSPFDLGGTASDNIAVTQVTWSNDRGGSGTASGTSNWNATGIALQTGTNILTVTAHDGAGNTGGKSIVVTFGTTTVTTYYISPTGNNSNDGLTPSTPWKTFAKAFAAMAAGDELILLDGIYSQAAGTGYISHLGTNSAQPPSGSSLAAMTYIHALNPGSVRVVGDLGSVDYERNGLFLGRNSASGKSRFIKVQGITFEGGGSVYNADYVTIKDCGFDGSFGIGTNDHDQFNDHNLIEDVWIWGSGERIIAINYRSHFNVWRRVLVRGDGCGTGSCSGSGNPNVGITVYDSNNISLQNVMVVDRILAPGDEPYGDFASAQHTPVPDYYFGQNEWLGTLSLNAPDTGYFIEPDAGATVDPTIRISNAVAWNTADGGFNIARAGTNNLLENLTIRTINGTGIRVAPELTTGVLRNAIVTGAGSFAINSKYPPAFVDTFFSAGSGTFNQTTCSTGCLTSNPVADGVPSLKHLTRIEAGSLLKGAGFNGADIGANILNRYGVDGSRVGDADYNTLTAVPLWPWPNEARIKKEMCQDSGVTRGFCSGAAPLGSGGGIPSVTTLTTYIWEALGNPIPAGIYP